MHREYLNEYRDDKSGFTCRIYKEKESFASWERYVGIMMTHDDGTVFNTHLDRFGNGMGLEINERMSLNSFDHYLEDVGGIIQSAIVDAGYNPHVEEGERIILGSSKLFMYEYDRGSKELRVKKRFDCEEDLRQFSKTLMEIREPGYWYGSMEEIKWLCGVNGFKLVEEYKDRRWYET